jgi:hypothetical protein
MLGKVRNSPVLCSVHTPTKGEPSRTPFNREFPHRALILAEDMRAAQPISKRIPCRRGRRKDDNWYRLYCFAERRHALSFQLKFGGELLDRPPPN